MGIQYQIILRAGDGTEFGPFPIRDHYFEREWTKIGVEVRREIMEHDQTYEIGAHRDGG